MENENTTGVEVTTTERTYTEAEVQDLLQREGDRRVTAALKKQQEKYEKQQAEVEKLRDMDDSQKREYSLNKKEEELLTRERELTLEQNKLEASKILSERGIPSSFVDYVVADNAEATMNNITLFENNWKSAISAEVQQRMAQPAPKGATSIETGISKEQFRKMNLSQQAELYRTNPELYKQLTTR